MKLSLLKRLEQLEFRRLPKLFKPILVLRPGAPEPENPDDYRIIRFVRTEKQS